MKPFRKLFFGLTIIGMITALVLLGCDNPFDSDDSSSGPSVPRASAPGGTVGTDVFGELTGVTPVSSQAEAESFLDDLLAGAFEGLEGMSGSSVVTAGLRAQSDDDEDIFGDFLDITDEDGLFTARSREDSFDIDLADLGMAGTIAVTNFNVDISATETETATQESISASIRTALRAAMTNINLDGIEIPTGVLSMAVNAELRMSVNPTTDVGSVSYAFSIAGSAGMTVKHAGQGAHLLFTINASDSFSKSGTEDEVMTAIQERLESRNFTVTVDVYGADTDTSLTTRDLTGMLPMFLEG